MVDDDDLDLEVREFIHRSVLIIFDQMNESETKKTKTYINKFMGKDMWDSSGEFKKELENKAQKETFWDKELNNIVKKAFCKICGSYSKITNHVCNILMDG